MRDGIPGLASLVIVQALVVTAAAPAAPVGELFQVIVNVEDMERQVGYYRDDLGFEVVESSPPGDPSRATFVRLRTGGAFLALHAGRESLDGAPEVRLSFLCDDVVAARKRLLGLGAPLGPIRSPAPGVLVVDTLDPEGNPLHLESRIDPAGAGPETAASARQALEQWLAAFEAGDWERVIDFYSAEPSFHWIEEGRGAYTSKDAVREGIEELYPNVERYTFEVDKLDVEALSGRLARTSIEYRQEIVFPGGQTLAFAGSMTALLMRAGEGWSLLTGYSAAEATTTPAAPDDGER